MRRFGLVFLWILFAPGVVFGQKEKNTLGLDRGQKSPNAKIEDVAWIAGHWRGEAFGGATEEVWAPPQGGSMMACFKMVVDNTVKFYELITISEENESLVLRLKHFTGDLKGWEEKDEVMTFPLVKITDTKVYFQELTFEKVNDNSMNVYVVMSDHDRRKEVMFAYNK